MISTWGGGRSRKYCSIISPLRKRWRQTTGGKSHYCRRGRDTNREISPLWKGRDTNYFRDISPLEPPKEISWEFKPAVPTPKLK